MLHSEPVPSDIMKHVHSTIWQAHIIKTYQNHKACPIAYFGIADSLQSSDIFRKECKYKYMQNTKNIDAPGKACI